MEMRRRLRFAGRARGEAEQRHVVATGFTASKRPACQAHAIELGIVIGGPVEADHLLQKQAVLGAGDQFVHQPRIAKCESDLGLVDDLAEFPGANIGIVLTTTAPAFVVVNTMPMLRSGELSQDRRQGRDYPSRSAIPG